MGPILDVGSPNALKQVDRLVLKELVGPWIFGVAMFTALIMAATYLNKIADYVVRGLPLPLIAKITILLMPAILAKTFAMAMLLAALLAFGRLSSDSEIIAMRAAGASIFRIVRPVMIFSLLVALVTFYFNNNIAPVAVQQSIKLVMSLDNSAKQKSGDPVFFPVDGAEVVAQEFDALHNTLHGVLIVAINGKKEPSFFMSCKELEYHRDTQEWHVRGGAYIVPSSGGQRIDVKEAFPAQVAAIKLSPEDITTINNHDQDAYSMSDAMKQIERGRKLGTLTLATIHNLEYGYWTKISVALAAFVFGTLGAVLGIRNQRTSSASGFALAIGIIFGYFMLTNFMSIWALNGVLPAWAASFAPVVLGLICSGVIMWRRNS